MLKRVELVVKRCAVTLEAIASFDNLASAFHRAARGKRREPEVRAFEADIFARLTDLGERIRTARAPVHRYRRFQIRDPKPRVIHAPIFEDRVVHHALMGLVGPDLDRALIDDAYACREGKGCLAAVLRAQDGVRRYPFYVKIDIRKYFASICHDRLLVALSKKIRNRSIAQLFERIVRGFESSKARGLPIGALTSQYLANFYLSPLDRRMLGQPGVRALVRYMDDIVFWCARRKDAAALLALAGDFVRDRLDLSLKGDGFIQRSSAGLSFLGFRIYPGVLKLSRRRMQRYRVARSRAEEAFAVGALDALGLQRAYDSALAITAHADAVGFRRADLGLRPAQEV